jgi:hypothetical protein
MLALKMDTHRKVSMKVGVDKTMTMKMDMGRMVTIKMYMDSTMTIKISRSLRHYMSELML